MRFPGQTAGAWSSTYQSNARDYDSAVGRYIESDPVGLRSGVNTYAYVLDNPLSHFDPFEQFEPWGQSGSQHSCKIADGPFVAFEWGHVRIRGQFKYGQRTGIWRWYKPDGTVEKELDYSKAH